MRQPTAWKSSSVLPVTPATWNATFPNMPKLNPATSDAVIVRFAGAPGTSSRSLGVVVKLETAQRTGMASRLRAIVEQWIGAQPQKGRPLSDGLIDLREAIKKRLKPLDLQFYYKHNKDQIRAAEAILPDVTASQHLRA